MSEYVVSALKYRPNSFATLIGQDNIAKTLKNSIIRGQLAHAYLFCGPRGVGKTSAARIFAKTINCSNPGVDMEPCGECESCVSFKEGRSYCIHELDAASNNGVDDIKSLMEQVQIPPQVGKYSVYIIDEVHMLSQAAFNAFLKTLEEPPAYAIFILATTEKHKVLPTILSRCQTYDFNRIFIPDIVKNLRQIADNEGINIDEESLHIIAQKADGAMRDALTIFDQTIAFCGKDINYRDVMKNLNVLDYEYGFDLVEAFLAGDYVGSLKKFDAILNKGFNALHFVSALSSHFRDLIVSKNGGADSLLELPPSLIAKYKDQSQRCNLQFLYKALETLVRCEAGYKASVNPRLHIEFHLMKITFLSAGFPEASSVGQSVQKQSVQKQPVKKSVAKEAPEEKVQKQPVEKSVAKEAPEEKVQKQPVEKSVAKEAPEEKVQKQPVKKSVAKEAPEEKVQKQPVEKSVAKETSEEKVQKQPVEKSVEEEALKRQKARKARRKKTSTIGTALSIDNLIDEHESQAPTEVNPINRDDRVPEDEEILANWGKVVEHYASKPRLAMVLKTSNLKIKEENGVKIVTFSVLNDAQKKWIEQKLLHEIEGILCKLIGTSKINLRIFVIPSQEMPKKKYRPEDQLKEIAENNDEVVNLLKDLEMDFQ